MLAAQQVQAEAATPETPRPRFDIQRPREEMPSRESETLPLPLNRQEIGPDVPMGEEVAPSGVLDDEVRDGEPKRPEAPTVSAEPKKKGLSRLFKKPVAIDERKDVAPQASVVQFRQPRRPAIVPPLEHLPTPRRNGG